MKGGTSLIQDKPMYIILKDPMDIKPLDNLLPNIRSKFVANGHMGDRFKILLVEVIVVWNLKNLFVEITKIQNLPMNGCPLML